MQVTQVETYWCKTTDAEQNFMGGTEMNEQTVDAIASKYINLSCMLQDSKGKYLNPRGMEL